ncbi:MAG: TIGR01777 family oxidoreductase [Phycisphaerales bacterium]|nr:TIGR01777 family oxidoreductase [Phycisphaerales bacterium]
MKIFITGASGTIGRRIVADRLRRGDHVLAMTRQRSRLSDEGLEGKGAGTLEIIEGDPGVPGPWQQAIDGCDAVLHLAGAGVMDRRWSSTYRVTLRESRIDSTYQVVRAIELARQPPRVLLNASAIGFYGDRDDRQLDETDDAGTGFLAHLCAEWEAQAMRAEPTCRVVCMRFGMVLDAAGGALPKMLKIFRKGLGGRLGNGRQYVSWVAWPDIVAMVELFLQRPEIRGPVNIVSPEPVTNRVFTAVLGEVLRRPTLMWVPGMALKLVLGGAAEVVLSSQRVMPGVLKANGFEWLLPTIESGLRGTVRDDGGTRVPERPSMLVIDIDELSPGAPLLRRVLRRAADTGTHVVLATSMGPEGGREFLEQSQVDCSIIVCDGAAVIQRDPSRMSYQRVLEPQTQAELLAAIAGCGHPVEVTLEDLHSRRRVTSDPATTQPIQGCLRIRIDASTEALRAVLEAIGPRWWQPGHVQVHRDRPGRLDILNAMADRSVALQHLARTWTVRRDDVRAVLKGVRSSGLAEWCGQAIALSGSDQRVRSLCGRVSSLDGIDGVAEAVEALT